MTASTSPTPEPHLWARPVPTIGDPSSAAERAAAPDGWAFAPEVQQALHKVIGARRDIRRFRPDPVPEELLRHVIEAGHAAPSVGHSQPWRFIIVRDPATRERAANLADQQRLTQAFAMTPEKGRQLLDLKLEGLREAPVGLVVAVDRRVPSLGVLGRATFTEADVWGCVCAVENMWLTARAAGLGMGWVTLFEPADLASMLGLPEGVETLGWLCVGWPDELPPGPGLERRAWSSKLPLDDVILHERWPAEGDAPAPPVSHLRSPDQARTVAATDDADELLTTPGSLGVLDRALDRVVAAGRGDVTGGTLVLAGADHPVFDLGVSAYPAGTTREIMLAALAGEAVGTVTAAASGFGCVVVDCGVDGLGGAPDAPADGAAADSSFASRGSEPFGSGSESGGVALSARPIHPRGNVRDADALDPADVASLVETGRALGKRLAADGLVLLGEVGLGNTTVASALAAALTGLGAAEAVGLGAGSDSDMLARKVAVVAGVLDRVGLAGLAPESVTSRELLASLGGGEIALLTGVVLGSAEAGTIVVLDGLATSVAALLAVREEPGAAAYLVAGQVSRERAHAEVLRRLGLEPLLDLRLRAGEGVGASMAGAMLLTGLRVRREAGRVADRGDAAH
ncbi:MAG: 5,6-dimethylbenzimidazole synthase [Dermatophilus congolensis]|nr:5,6-dimethylbenzimidazole synthase [Dermatophilus congolensis]